MILRLNELPLAGQRVLLRLDLNVPLSPDGTLRDDTRIREALPTIQAICAAGGIPIVLSHLGRPKGQHTPGLSLAPVARHLATLLDRVVHFSPDCIGERARRTIADARTGEVVVLENLRFHPGEEANDPEFAAQLAHGCQVYVNDAFGAAHRAHASVVAITEYVRWKGMGLLMERELRALRRLITTAESPYVVLMGGAKVSDKVAVLRALLPRCDALLIGGGMCFTFLRAQGVAVGSSLVEEAMLPVAQELVDHARRLGKRLLLPVDICAVQELTPEARCRYFRSEEGIPEGWIGVDIGPESIELFAAELRQARTIFWNGPMGIYELEPFRAGTRGMARAVAEATRWGAFTVVGGGDSVAAVTQLGFSDAVGHLSTGGGAALEFLAGMQLPGLAALEVAGQS